MMKGIGVSRTAMRKGWKEEEYGCARREKDQNSVHVMNDSVSE